MRGQRDTDHPTRWSIYPQFLFFWSYSAPILLTLSGRAVSKN